MKHAMGGGAGRRGEGKDNQMGLGPVGGGLETRPASGPWGGRNPDSQPAGLGLETC